MRSNFEFLREEFPVLARLGEQAERNVYADPNTCMIKTGKIGETIVRWMFEHHQLEPYVDSRDDHVASLIWALNNKRILPSQQYNRLNMIRLVRNNSAHEDYEDHLMAMAVLKQCYELCEWYAATYGVGYYTHHEFVVPTTDPDEMEEHWDRDERDTEGVFLTAPCGDGEVVVIGYTGGDTDTLVVPAYDVDGNKVVRIGGNAFCRRADIRKVIVGDGIRSIGQGAFACCYGLAEVTLPDSLIELGSPCCGAEFDDRSDGVFKATAVTQIHLPAGLKEIGNYAYASCRSLKSVELPSVLQTIGRSAFNDCESLTEIILPHSTRTIYEDAFAQCYCLCNVVLNDGLTTIRAGAFCDTNLEQLVIPDSVVDIGHRGRSKNEEDIVYSSVELRRRIPFEIASYSNIGVEIVKYTGPDQECIRIPAVIDGRNVVSIGEGALRGLHHLEQVHIPEGVRCIKREAFARCGRLKDVVIPDQVAVIEPYAFLGCDRLVHVELSHKLQRIEDSAFGYCAALTRIEIPGCVVSIEKWAFIGCISLTNVILHEGLQRIGDAAFKNVPLGRIDIPMSVTDIGDAVVGRNTMIGCYPGSTAMDYAIERGYGICELSDLV